MADDASRKLKHLSFVQDYSLTGVQLVEKYYEFAKAKSPKVLAPYVARVEEQVLAYGASAIATASDAADKLLRTADQQVDVVYATAAKWLSLEPLRQMHSNNLATYKVATEKYFALIAGTTDWVASKVGSDKNVQYAKEVVAAALKKAQEAVDDPDAAVDMAFQAWLQFAGVPTVAKLLSATAPVTDKGLAVLGLVHDKVVTSPLYARSFSLGVSTLQWATTTMPYRLSARYVYPYVQPIADPTLQKLSKSEYLHKAVDYWKPTAAQIVV